MADGLSAALDKVEALVREAEGRGFGLLEFAEGGMQLRVAFRALGTALAEDAPPSALPGISPSRGEIGQSPASRPPISSPEGQMPGRAEGDRPERRKAAQSQQTAIVSPGVGFLRLSHAGGGRFPGEGEEVAAGAVVAMIQAGPLLQPVTAPHAGRLGRVLVAEGAGVGFGTALFAFA